MNAYAVSLFPGARLFFGGDVVEVVDIDGLQTTVRNERTGEYGSVPLGQLAAGARSMDEPAPTAADGVGLLLASLSADQRQRLRERAGHVREVLSGYRSGHAADALPVEPRPAYDPDLPLKERTKAKAAELGVSPRTLQRWVTAYRESGDAGLVDARAGRGSSIDPRWEDAVRRVVAESVTSSTPTRSALLSRVEERLNSQYGKGVVPVPSRSTAYARLAALTKGTNAVSGSAKARRSIADRPQGAYGRLRAARPGEYVVLDTQDLDIYAMEPVTCRWVPLQLTVAQDLFSRCIVGLRVTACSTKALDVAGVLFEAVCPPLEDSARPAVAPYHGLWDEVVFTEEGLMPGGGLCPPETLVIDHGRAFMSAHVIGVCTRLGMSIQPAQPKKPTDKPTVERFFRTLREGLIQHLPAYKGPDVHSRGEAVEDAAFFFTHEVEEIIREWVSEVYHRREHDGLVIPQWPKLPLSPLEMLRIGLARAGRLRMPASPELAFQFLAVKPRTIQHYGVEVDGLRYNGPVLDGYRNAPSPYPGFGRQWPIHVNPDDVRFVYFQDPADDSWHPLNWEHAPALHMAFSGEAAAHARRLAARKGRHVDSSQALADLLTRWDQGMVTDRRERRIAVRLSAERGALSLPVLPEQSGPLTSPELRLVPELPPGDSDDEAELFDVPEGDDFYADAFEVIE
ncbi:helix-turn-helix domain-containing protein [Streptomyces luteogriseus]|uniref:helix-turn-helix domain-containing protein n=1 Tax=Streptomyces luteogriseus TaxID=68233 RepID=UPI0037B24EE4